MLLILLLSYFDFSIKRLSSTLNLPLQFVSLIYFPLRGANGSGVTLLIIGCGYKLGCILEFLAHRKDGNDRTYNPFPEEGTVLRAFVHSTNAPI